MIPRCRLRPTLVQVLSVAGCLLALPALAGPNLVSNGSFENCLSGSTIVTCGNGQMSTATPSNVQSWTTTSGYTFVIPPSAFSTTGGVTTITTSSSAYGTLTMGSFNSQSPDGGNFLLSDGAFLQGTLSQTITGLVVGQKYNVAFDQAATQQSGYTGITTDYWQVSLGSITQDSAVMTVPSQGFSPWVPQLLTFTANAVSMVLGFMAVGTPGGQPPFAAIDGISLVVAVPEPGTLSTFCVALFGLAALRRRRPRES